MLKLILGIIIPFIGTSLGAGMVFFMKDKLNPKLEKFLTAFAGGVMMAASIWSLIIPSIDLSSSMNKFSFIPATTGILLGLVFLLLVDNFLPQLRDYSENISHSLKTKKTKMLTFAVTLHNIPEGMAVGIALASAFFGNSSITMTAAIILSVGIAIQNFPEGAIISMPLKSEGIPKFKSFSMGVLSGIVEPIFATVTILLAKMIEPLLPYFLAFAAGAMIYVAVEELIPQSKSGEKSNLSTIGFNVGFLIMMILDVTLS